MGEVEAVLRPDKKPFEPAECREVPPELAAALRVVYAFTSLTELEFHLVQRLMRGESMAQIGKRQGVTRAAISAMVKKMVEKHPSFGFLRLEG